MSFKCFFFIEHGFRSRFYHNMLCKCFKLDVYFVFIAPVFEYMQMHADTHINALHTWMGRQAGRHTFNFHLFLFSIIYVHMYSPSFSSLSVFHANNFTLHDILHKCAYYHHGVRSHKSHSEQRNGLHQRNTYTHTHTRCYRLVPLLHTHTHTHTPSFMFAHT